MNYSKESTIKCFTCNSWTTVKYMKPRLFHEREQLICLACAKRFKIQDNVNKTIEMELEAMEDEHTQTDKPSEDNGTGRTDPFEEGTEVIEE